MSSRRCALLCSVEVIINLAEDYAPLHEDMISFYSELLEDPETAQLCEESILKIEVATNQSLRKYF